MNIDKPLLSIIVPLYNTEEYLEKCIESIIKQTYENLEIILIDDGSTDRSVEICQKYVKQDERVKLFTTQHGGQGKARKVGVFKASGNFIGFVDSDDWIESNMFERLMQCIIDYNCDIVSSGMCKDYEGRQKTEILYDNYQEGFYDNLVSDIYPTMVYDDNCNSAGVYGVLVNKIFRKHLLTSVYDEINEDVFFGEDTLVCYTYMMLAENIYIMRNAFYHYNIRKSSTCFREDTRLPSNNYLVYSGLKSVFLKSRNPEILMMQLKRYLLYLEFHTLKTLYHINITALAKWEFSYHEDIFNTKFVIYGAGACGQALFKKICRDNKKKNLVAWVDKNAEEKREECNYTLEYPKELVDMEYSAIIIAVKSQMVSLKIKEELKSNYSIPEEKIYWNEVSYTSIF